VAAMRGSLGRRGCWVGLEGRVGLDSLGIWFWVLKGIQTQKEFKPEFELQQKKEMHQHVCNKQILYFINFILEKFLNA
jgi:hypothetical protein